MTERRRSFPLILFLCSGGLSILSEFLNWTYDFSPWGFFVLFGQTFSSLIFLFPLIAGIIIFVSGPLLTRSITKIRYLYYILLLVALELIILFLYEMFASNDRFLWQYIGIYIQSLASGLLFFAIILQSSSPLRTAENPDSA